MTTTYWTTEDIAALSDEALLDLEESLRRDERIGFALQTRQAARRQRRAAFLLERMVWPELDRRRR